MNNNPINIIDINGIEREIQIVSLISSNGELINFTNNAIDVVVQDQFTTSIVWYLSQKLNSISLASDAIRGSYQIELNPGHNCVVGNFIEIWDGAFYQVEIIAVNVNIITLAKPIPFNFVASTTQLMQVNVDMNIDGSSTPVDFTFKPLNNYKYDIRTVSGIMATTGVPDDGKFSGITALTNGILIGKINPTLPYDGYEDNIRDNFTLKIAGFDVKYTDKAPAGIYGTEFIKIWSEKNGVLTRVNGENGEYVIGKIRDNLTGINLMRTTVIGHLVE